MIYCYNNIALLHHQEKMRTYLPHKSYMLRKCFPRSSFESYRDTQIEFSVHVLHDFFS